MWGFLYRYETVAESPVTLSKKIDASDAILRILSTLRIDKLLKTVGYLLILKTDD